MRLGHFYSQANAYIDIDSPLVRDGLLPPAQSLNHDESWVGLKYTDVHYILPTAKQPHRLKQRQLLSRREDARQLPETTYPAPEDWEYATPRQASRAARSFDILRSRAVPVYWGPLMVPDEDEVVPQRAEDVMRRIAVLWAVALRGDGYSQAETLGLIEEQDLWDVVSPSERSFLLDESPPESDCMASVWRLESISALLWALGYMDVLAWPDRQCDVPKLVEILDQIENEPDFARPTELRCTSELLDARDLMMRLEWAVRDAYLHQDFMLPVNLDWSGDSEFVPLMICDAPSVVSQRFHTFVWLTSGSDGTDWDDMDTST